MKPKKQILFIAVALVLLCGCSKKSFKPDSKNLKSKYVKVQDVLNVVEVAVATAMASVPESNNGVVYKTSAGSDPDNLLNYLKSVEVELANSFSHKEGTDVSFWIVKGGVSRSSEKSTSFSYSFEPKTKAAKLGKTDSEQKAGKDLIEALKRVGTCLKDFDASPYTLKEVSIQVQFEVSSSAELGAEFKIIAFGISPSGALEWGHGNTITLTFDLSSRP